MAIIERERRATERHGRSALTDSERRLLLLLAMQLSIVESAWLLASSPAEVIADRTRLFHKLGVTSDDELAPFAARHGLAA
jgi:DNA-binding CsgD family transcriptional regulator